MGELSRPIMTPLGVVYRSLHPSEQDALKYSEWAVKLFGGSASAFEIVGPGAKGFYESTILSTVPVSAKCMKRPAEEWPSDWYGTPTRAYVLFNDLETPIALYFHDHQLVFKPKSEPPMTAFFSMGIGQS